MSWWVKNSYFNHEQIHIGGIEIMTDSYGSSESFGSRVRSKFIGHNKYTFRRIIFHSKPTLIHGPVHNSGLNYSYSRSHFSRLPQVVAQKLINRLSHKVSYASKIIDIIINGFIPHEVIIHLYICYHSIVLFLFLGISNTYRVDSLDRFRKSVVDKVKTEVYIFLNNITQKKII